MERLGRAFGWSVRTLVVLCASIALAAPSRAQLTLPPLQGPAKATQATERLLASLSKRTPDDACAELERALAAGPAEADRRALLAAFVARSPRSAAPASEA